MPSPPRSMGLMTFSQATKQLPPLASFLPVHKKTSSNLINSSQEPLGNFDGDQQVVLQ